MSIGEKAFRTKYKIRTGSIKNAFKAYLRQQVILKRNIRKIADANKKHDKG
jgi:hypothetical protein